MIPFEMASLERPEHVSEAHAVRGGAAPNVDQSAARKVIHFEGGSFYVLLI